MPNISHSSKKTLFKIWSSEKGFTLLEVLAVVTIFSFLLAMACSLFMYQANFFQYAAKRLDVQQNVRVAADFITRELRYAEDLEIVNSQEVKYTLPDDDKLLGIRLRINSSTNDKEIMIVYPGTANLITYNIESLDFSLDEPSKILYFTIKGADGRYSYTLRSAVYMPNCN